MSVINAFAALEEDSAQYSVPSWWLTIVCQSRSRGSNTSFWSQVYSGTPIVMLAKYSYT